MDRIYTACSAKLIIEIWSASHILWMLEERAHWACLAEISGPPVDDYASAGPCRWGQSVYQRSTICRRGLPVFIWVHPAVRSDCSTFKARLMRSLLKEEPRHRKRGSPFLFAVTTSRRCHVGVKVWCRNRDSWHPPATEGGSPDDFKAAVRWELYNRLRVKQLQLRTPSLPI